MYVDFVGLAMDQIANQMAKVRYMTGGQVTVPMVLRTQGGTGRSAGAAAFAEPGILAGARPGASGGHAGHPRRCKRPSEDRRAQR